ncbi:MAG TPA: hypothetical protein VGQ62_08325 [Chloroflexota bacterium]|jgi:hypothetical protein|nr:hypothetical protein [Chloroflexota bacterium]
MKFRTGDLEFNANVADSTEAPSAQTGDLLRSLTIQFRAQKAAIHEQVLVAATERQNGGLFSLTDDNEPDLEWRIRDSSTQYVGTEPWGINHHVWRIEQVERLACERLVVGDNISLEPYDYAESVNDEGVVRLAARALVSEADLVALSQLTGAVAIARIGISNTSRQMTLDYVWGPGLNGLSVVVRAEDAREPRLTLQMASLAGDAFADLIAVLHAHSALDHTAIAELQLRRHAARQVSRIDTWSLTE